MRHGDKTLLGIAKASCAYGSEDHKPLFLFRQLKQVMLDCVLNGDLSKDFYSNDHEVPSKKKLVPIIFCHGISSNRTMHSGLCKDMAGHGYIVFSLDHQDGTCTYT